MKTGLLFSALMIISVSSNLSTQNAKIDSLVNLLDQQKNEDIAKVNLLNDIAEVFLLADYEICIN